MKRRNICIVTILLTLITGVSLYLFKSQNIHKYAKIRIGDELFCVEIADTINALQFGLSGRIELDGNSGMLFVFPQEDYLVFWMHDTYIPLSLAFVSAEGIISEIHDMQPLSYLQVKSKRKCKYALELKKGALQNNFSAIGTKIEVIEHSPDHIFLFN